ncbi:unnamed protein product [Darwinula stevensoni]|uniref:Uncharacterized protein n=1 Tax=Darwinula stevensoni TaxID=69355 RepID=A0A7R9A5R4_9CRUS|nr:unnamed protein product [Darwinula stevensoni]CAG0887050.1 unnamed protein product [Darwinula stevensoni]
MSDEGRGNALPEEMEKDRGEEPDLRFLTCALCDKKYHNPKVRKEVLASDALHPPLIPARPVQVLPCLHTFCETCLAGVTPPGSLALTCPVHGLETNFYLTSFLESVKEEEEDKDEEEEEEDEETVIGKPDPSRLIFERKFSEGSQQAYSYTLASLPSPSDSIEGFLHCPTHPGQCLRFYCWGCEWAVCSSCTDTGHRGHAVARLSAAANRYRIQLQHRLNTIQSQVTTRKTLILKVEEITERLQERKTNAEESVNATFDSLISALETQRARLLGSVDRIAKAKLQALEEQRGALESEADEMQRAGNFLRHTLTEGTDTEVLLVKNQMIDKLEEWEESPYAHGPVDNSHLSFREDVALSLKPRLLSVGSITSTSAVPWQSAFSPYGRDSGEEMSKVPVGKSVRFVLQTRDKDGNPTEGAHPFLKATFTMGNLETEIPVEPSSPGRFYVTLTVPKEGPLSLSITLFGEHVKGSPLKVSPSFGPEKSLLADPVGTERTERKMKSSHPSFQLIGDGGREEGASSSSSGRTSLSLPPRSRLSRSSKASSSSSLSSSRRSCVTPLEDDLIGAIGTRGRGKGQFTNPQGVCCTTSGEIVVTDSNNQCVQVFSPEGECILRFGVRGRGVGQLQRPTGVTVLPSGSYAVADYDNRCVSVFQSSGKFITRIGVNKLLGPKGVSVTHGGKLLVVDNKGGKVVVFGADGRLEARIGDRKSVGSGSSGKEALAGPHFVAVTARGRIAVSDFHNHCVKVYEASGELAFSFGTNGDGNGQFNAPTGVAVDGLDNLLVADWGNSRIQVFDSRGTYMGVVNAARAGLYGPQGLAVSPLNESILVADSGNHCVKVYENKFSILHAPSHLTLNGDV